MGLNKGALERLGYFQYEMLAHNLKMFGKPPPSSVPIQIPQPELDQLHPVKGEDKLMDLFEQEPRYVDVAVDGDDFAKYLEDLRRRFPT